MKILKALLLTLTFSSNVYVYAQTQYQDSLNVGGEWGQIKVPDKKVNTKDIRELQKAEVQRLRKAGYIAEANKLEKEMTTIDRKRPDTMLPPNYKAVLTNDPLLYGDLPDIIRE